jgi:hypothetical protein
MDMQRSRNSTRRMKLMTSGIALDDMSLERDLPDDLTVVRGRGNAREGNHTFQSLWQLSCWGSALK